MEPAEGRRIARMMFYIAAMIVCFGLGTYLMGYGSIGVVLLIIGAALLVISFSVLKFLMLLSFRR